MGIEGGSNNNEVQNKDINQSNNEQIEQNQAEHQRSGEELEANSTIDNEGERKQIEDKDDDAESTEDEFSKLDNDDSIENESNQDQPEQNKNIASEQQQLDNQGTIEGKSSSADGMSEDNKEITDSLDSDDSIEDSDDLFDADDSDDDNGSAESLDQDDLIEADDEGDSDNDNEETDARSEDENSLNSEDSIDDENDRGELDEADLEQPDETENIDLRPGDFVARESSKNDSYDKNEERREVSDELKYSLETFEQSNWENMPLEQKKEAVENLRDSVANDLGLQEKPDVKYYNNNDDGDFGGYFSSENTIYLNEYNMGDEKEIADTIAHESRHCGQHEIAKNSDSQQAQAFKENFDDYIKPEDDYRGYRNQPVEVDARDYSRDITDNIPTEQTEKEVEISSEISSPNATDGDIRQNQENKGAVFDVTLEMPTDLESKVGDFESKVKAPDYYESKFEYDTQQKLEDYYKEDGGKLTDNQKDQLVSDLKNSYDRANKSDRGDVLVPENSKDVTSMYYNGKTGKYDIGYDWKPVDTVPESRNMEVIKEGQLFDRVGLPSGRCTGAVGEDGSCATVKERSIPYHFNEEDITKELSYHRYKAEQDFTKENLSNSIDNSMYSYDKKAEMHDNLDRYYENANAKGYGDGDGIASGEIAPMFENTTGATGGGKQYDMPFSMEELEDIGMISEVPKETY